MTLRAFVSSRLVTREGIRPGAILVSGEQIDALVAPGEIPRHLVVEDFGTSAILPGLVDSHVHLNVPGRTEWEGFETGTRAASAGGYTTLVDMPLNCLPATTSVEALETKRAAAKDKCRIDWAAWGGVVSNNQPDIEPLAAAGVLGFKCFLVHPGIDGFSMVTEAELRSALPCLAQTALPLLVHAELPAPIKLPRRLWRPRTGPVTRCTCNRAPTKQNYARFKCSCRYAGSTAFACMLSTCRARGP
jgi:allantoinase